MTIKCSRFSRDRYYIFLLVFLSIITHIVWFTPNSIITNSDWGHYQQNALNELFKTAGTWMSYNNFGAVNIQLPFYAFMSVWSLLGHLGLSYDIATKITFFAPIAILNFVAPYTLFKSIFKDKNAAFAGAIFYGTTTYGIANDPPIQMVYALAPLIFYYFIRATNDWKLVNWIIFLLLYSLGITYEVRIMYIVTIILFAYILCFKLSSIYQLLKASIFVIPAVVLLNLYWILATVRGATNAISATANRGLFGDNLFDLAHALTLTNWYWTGNTPNDSFIKQSIPLILWPIPVFILFSLTQIRKNTFKNWTLFFLLVGLLGVFLTKQVDEPFGFVYAWLYGNFPGFNLFREASKFFVLSSFGYAGLLTGGIIMLKKFRVGFVYPLVVITVVCIALTNAIPLVTGKFGGLFVSRHVPTSYNTVNDYLKRQVGFGRTYSLPASSRWLYYSQEQPTVSAVTVAQNDFQSYSTVDNALNPQEQVIEQSITEPLLKQYSQQLFNLASIRYIIVPLRDTANDDDFFQFYGNDRNFYIDVLNGIPWLKRLNVGTNQIAVYENKTYSSYFTASTELNQVSNFTNADNDYSFQSDALQDNSFDFTASNNLPMGSKTTMPTRKIEDINDFISPKSISANKISIKQALSDNRNNILYANTNQQEYSYQIINNNLDFLSETENLLSVDGNNIGNSAPDHLLYSAPIENGIQYQFSEGNLLNTVNDNWRLSAVSIGNVNTPLVLYKDLSSTNLINDGSFASGLWQSKVQDCNDYGDAASISMGLSVDPATKNGEVLEFRAGNHTACTSSNTINVVPGQKYSISYNYYLQNTQRAGYRLNFSNANHSIIQNYQVSQDQKWYTLNNIFTVPTNVHTVTLQLLGLPNENGQQYGKTYYTNVAIKPLSYVDTISDSPKITYTKINLSGDSFNAVVSGANYHFNNLIPNATFNDGLWQKKVGDCDAYDNHPVLNMFLNKRYTSTGSVSLELDATRHNACTGPPNINVQAGKTYMLSFDYQSPTESSASYYISFNNPNGTVISQTLSLNNTNWHTFIREFTAPVGSSYMSLSVYSFGDPYGRKKEINRYDNFDMIEMPPLANRYYIVSTATNKLNQPKNIRFTSNSPTKKLVTITGATTPFYLNMSEAYDTHWQLEINNSKVHGIDSWLPTAKPDVVSASDHYDLDDFANGWYVDINQLCKKENLCTKNPDGSYNLSLIVEFTPQRYFYVGLIISGATLVGCLSYLCYYFAKHRRPSKGKIYVAQK